MSETEFGTLEPDKLAGITDCGREARSENSRYQECRDGSKATEQSWIEARDEGWLRARHLGEGSNEQQSNAALHSHPVLISDERACAERQAPVPRLDSFRLSRRARVEKSAEECKNCERKRQVPVHLPHRDTKPAQFPSCRREAIHGQPIGNANF